MQYKVSTLRRSIDYKVSTLHSDRKVISFKNESSSYQVNRSPVNITIADPTMNQRVTELEALPNWMADNYGEPDHNFENDINTQLAF